MNNGESGESGESGENFPLHDRDVADDHVMHSPRMNGGLVIDNQMLDALGRLQDAIEWDRAHFESGGRIRRILLVHQADFDHLVQAMGPDRTSEFLGIDKGKGMARWIAHG